MITRYVIPLAITGPAATPLKTTTPMIVPSTKATVTCGTAANWSTPYLDKIATKIPAKTAIHPAGVLKVLIRSLKPICQVAIGIKIATEMTVTPQLIPFA